jgi:hypothetical protein
MGQSRESRGQSKIKLKAGLPCPRNYSTLAPKQGEITNAGTLYIQKGPG